MSQKPEMKKLNCDFVGKTKYLFTYLFIYKIRQAEAWIIKKNSQSKLHQKVQKKIIILIHTIMTMH